MAMQLSSAALIDAFCQADNSDLAFASLGLAHHQLAVNSSRGLLEQTQDSELRDLAQRVIAAQEAEISILGQVLNEHAIASPTP